MTTDSESELNKSANTCLGLGVGVGTLGAGAALAVGAVCPICIVATPLLITAGVVQKIRARRTKKIKRNQTESDSI
jgi:hypothetical protein